MANHFLVIGNRLVNRFEVLFTQLVTDTVIPERYKPTIRLRKRAYSRGRPKEPAVISDGITIAPVKASDEGGVSSREDVAYRFLVALGYGSWTDKLDDWPVAAWEQAIRRRYQQSRIGVTGIDGCEIATTVKPGRLPDGVQLEEKVDATFLEVAVWIRESRRDDQ